MKQIFRLLFVTLSALFALASCNPVEKPLPEPGSLGLDLTISRAGAEEWKTGDNVYLFFIPSDVAGKSNIRKLTVSYGTRNGWEVVSADGQGELSKLGTGGRLYAVYTEGDLRDIEAGDAVYSIVGGEYGETQTCCTDYTVADGSASAEIRLGKVGFDILITHLDAADGWELSTPQDGSAQKLKVISGISVGADGISIECRDSKLSGVWKEDGVLFQAGGNGLADKPLVIALKNLSSGKSYVRDFGETHLSTDDVCQLTGPDLDAEGAFISANGWELSEADHNKIFYRLSPASPKLDGYDEGEGSDVFGATIIAHYYNSDTGYGEIEFDVPVTRIGEDAFFEKSSIISVTVPQTVTSFGGAAFALCTQLSSINIPQGVTSISRGLLYGCSSLTSLVLPETLTEINDLAFQECSSLSEINIPQGVTRIGAQAFFGCSSLTGIIVPETVTEIGYFAFAQCVNLTGVELSPGLVSIRYQAFSSCLSLEDIKIPETVTTIEGEAFSFCQKLKSVTFSGELSIVGDFAFDGCDALSAFYGPNASADRRCLIIDNTLIAFAPAGIKEYTIPEEVIYFGFQAIISKEIEKISMSDNVLGARGESYIIYNLPNLKELTISARMEDVGSSFCADCPSLEKVYLRAPVPPNTGQWDRHPAMARQVFVPQESFELYKESPSWVVWRDYFTAYEYDDLPSDIELDIYCSTDYSRDGQVTTVQRATEGNGIDLVFMGDAFSDRQIADGTYREAMRKGIEAFFSLEPYKSFRHLFNIYIVDVVSKNEGYRYSLPALGTYFGEGTFIGLADYDLPVDYTCNAVPEERMDDATTVVMVNSDKPSGTCWMFPPEKPTDYGTGFSVSLVPVWSDEVAVLVLHEAGGHGFVKLQDEYSYEDMGDAPQDVIETVKSYKSWGWSKNVDITDDPAKVKWTHFLADSRYQDEGLGVFEGGLCYLRGLWHPSEDSMMNHNQPQYNAPSREAVYYRIHKLAYGRDWEYNYEDFVRYDAINRAVATRSPQLKNSPLLRSNTDHTPPVIVGKSWREARNR